MEVEFVKAPFPHVLIKNTFDKNKYDQIYNEIIELLPQTTSPEKTGALPNTKKGNGCFVDYIPAYSTDRSRSKILTYTKELFSNKVIEVMQKDECLFKYYYSATTCDWTLLQSYDDGDYYDPHIDIALFTCITLVYKEPKKYTDGELVFPQFEYNPKIENNQTIIFPSRIQHKVTPVNKKIKDIKFNRFTITKFLHYDTTKSRTSS